MKGIIKLVVVAFLSVPFYSVAQEKKPNVLMIAVDDWNDWVGAFGNDQIQTPNLDKLAAMGVILTHNQANATYCTPSRSSLMTGVAPWNSGLYASHPQLFNIPERMAMPELFKKNGYQVYGGGKIFHHMPGYLDLRGYDEYFHWNPKLKKKGWPLAAWDDNPATPKELPYSEIAKATRKNFDIAALPNSVEKEMADTQLCDWAAKLIGEEHKDPFFLSVGLFSPHKPNFAPQKYFDLYPLENISIPEGVLEEDIEDLPQMIQELVERKAKRNHKKLLTVEEGWKKALQGYMASISYADAQIGKILDALEDSPYAENTIIVFWSDHGYHLGEKETWAKHTLWERTTNAPLIWAGPGVKKGEEYKGVTSLLDIYPTLIDQCQLQGAQQMDGESIVKELKEPDRIVDRAVLTVDKEGNSFSVFTNQWHYINYEFGKGEELYNIVEDKHEWNNLAANEKYNAVKNELRKHIPHDPKEPAVNQEDLDLVLKGNSFEWVRKDGDSSGKKNKKNKKKNKKKKNMKNMKN